MTKTHSQVTSENVRAEMARNRLSQRDLAKHLKCSHTTLQRRLNGDVAFNVDELATVAKALGVPLSVLLPAERTAAQIAELISAAESRPVVAAPKASA